MPGVRIDGQYIPERTIREIISHYQKGSPEKRGLQNLITMINIFGDQIYDGLQTEFRNEAGNALREYLRRRNKRR